MSSTPATTPLGCPQCGRHDRLTIRYVVTGCNHLVAVKKGDEREAGLTSSPIYDHESPDPIGLDCDADRGGCGWFAEADEGVDLPTARAALVELLVEVAP